MAGGRMMLSAPATGKKRYSKGKTVSKIAKGKVTNIQTLAKAVKKLQNKDKAEANYFNLQQTGSQISLTSSPFVLNLSNYNNMGYCFGTGADEVGVNTTMHKSVGIDTYISLENTVNNEEETVQFTCFLVSLTDEATQVFNMQNNGIVWNGSPGTANQTHCIAGGLVLLNKRYFKVHKTKRFVLSNHGTALTAPSAQSQYGVDKRFYWSQKINKKINNPGGNWYALINGADPSKTYLMLVFSDNSTADLESPAITYSAVHTFKSIA